MATVFALIHGEKGAYGISFPDFQGCVAGGRTVAEAIQRGRDGLALHIEAMLEDGVALPEVRDLDALKADANFAEDFADATAVAALEIDLPGKAVRLNISLDESLVARIDRRASELGESRSGFLAVAAKARLAG